MSITGSMYTGAAGLGSHSDAMSIISDNIANVNTVGYKSGRGNFGDTLGNIIAGEVAGSGSNITSTQLNFSQGSLLGTGNTTDLAIRGDGFFLASGVVDGVDSTYYSRQGQFTLDENGFLVNPQGLKVQGQPIDQSGDLVNTVDDLQVEFNSIPPQETDSLGVVANLDASTAISGVTFNPADPGSTSDFSTTMTVYDSLGKSHQLDIYFNKQGDTGSGGGGAEWEYHVLTREIDVDAGASSPDTFIELTDGTATNGSLEFDGNGALYGMTMTDITANWVGAQPATITLDFGTPIDPIPPATDQGSGVDGITTYALASTVTYGTQNGFSSGDLAGLSFDDDGQMLGLFSNGQQRTLGQVSLARFSNNDGLERRGNGLYAATQKSGSPVIGDPSTGGRGSLAAGHLESSNVDLATEFVDLISIQRGFQSNSRTITTADEMLNEVLSLKR